MSRRAGCLLEYDLPCTDMPSICLAVAHRVSSESLGYPSTVSNLGWTEPRPLSSSFRMSAIICRNDGSPIPWLHLRPLRTGNL